LKSGETKREAMKKLASLTLSLFLLSGPAFADITERYTEGCRCAAGQVRCGGKTRDGQNERRDRRGSRRAASGVAGPARAIADVEGRVGQAATRQIEEARKRLRRANSRASEPNVKGERSGSDFGRSEDDNCSAEFFRGEPRGEQRGGGECGR